MESEVKLHQMLVVDDKASMRHLLEAAFKDRGFGVSSASNGSDAIKQIKERAFDIIITDFNMPGRTGLDVLRAAKEVDVDSQVIVITAYGTIDVAVEAMRLGAHDFITKPFKLAEIELKVDKILREKNLEGIRPATAEPKPEGRRMIGDSEATRQLLKMIDKIGPSRSSVLITGPSGTGKELVAKAIHDAGPRRDRPFVALNCAALAPGILESELFGHEKGSFTGAVGRRIGRFEQAHTGTLFLDEVGEIDPGIQTKLLRVLQEAEFERVGGADTVKVDVRIVAATNRDLREAIQQGLFREDFYYRLNVFSLRVEPLCQRPDDIPGLVDLFLDRFSRETNKTVAGVEDDVMALFMRYAWPGNVRELENVLERAVVLTEGATVTREDIPQEMWFLQDSPAGRGAGAVLPPVAPPAPKVPDEQASLIERSDQFECEMIHGALQKFRWNKTKTAEHLGLKRTTLQYKIKKYGLE